LGDGKIGNLFFGVGQSDVIEIAAGKQHVYLPESLLKKILPKSPVF
jgi:hypothetical protein